MVVLGRSCAPVMKTYDEQNRTKASGLWGLHLGPVLAEMPARGRFGWGTAEMGHRAVFQERNRVPNVAV